ncbi:pmpB [Symbiodinium sp. CCMP2456]|nr:pmpB [Symbiodinium sp. CCMP2456]
MKGCEFIFLDAPHSAAGAFQEETAAEKQEAAASEGAGPRGWWVSGENARKQQGEAWVRPAQSYACVGFEEGIACARDAAVRACEDGQQIHGVLAFSQGCAVATCLLREAQLDEGHPLASVNLAILVGGFVPRDPETVLLLVPAALLAFTCFTGRFTKHIQSAGPVPASEIPGRRLQWSTEDCELVQWDDLCGHQLPVGKCFRIQPRTASVCELLGPDNSGEPSLLLGDGLVTLQTEGSLRITGNLRVKSARFEAESIVFQDAQVETQQSAANSSAQGGGFMAEGMLTLAAGTLDLENTHATTSGGGFVVLQGFAVSGSVLATNGSAIHIRSSRAGISAGGFLAEGQYVNFTNRSTVHMQNVRAEHYAGGFYARTGSVIIESMSEVMVVNGHAAKYDGGGFVSRKRMEVDDGSSIRLRSVSAGRSGGGFMASRAKALIRGNSRLLISDSHATYGGGFYAAFLEVSNNATVGIQNSSAGKDGGGFYACGCHDNPVLRRFLRSKVVKVSNSSTLRIDKTIALELGGGFASSGSVVLTAFSNVAISDSQAMQDRGGGMYVEGSLRIVDGSMLRVQNVHAKFAGALLLKYSGTTRLLVRNESLLDVRNATAGAQAGGFLVDKVLVAAHSQIRIEDCNGGRGSGGGFFTYGLQVSDHGSIMIRNCSVGGGKSGGGFYVQSESHKAEASVLLANNSMVSIHATNASYGAGFVCTGQVLLANNSTLQISDSHASKFSGGFSASALQVTDQSAVFLENVTAARQIGGFRAERGVLVSNSSEICIRRAVAAKDRGGFASYGPVVVAKNSQISVSDSYARSGAGGGFIVRQELAGALAAVRVTGGSTVSISNTASRLYGGGFAAWRGDVVIADGSKLRIRNTASFSSHSGGFGTDRRVLVANNSLITIRNSTSKQNSGGFWTKSLEVTARSAVRIASTQTGGFGGGFWAEDLALVAGHSEVTVSDSHAIEGSGGGFQTSKLYLEGNSSIDLQTASAGDSGGGVNAANFSAGSESLVVANGSALRVRNATARLWGGGIRIIGRAVITGWSNVQTSDCHATSYNGGGISVSAKLLLNESSDVNIQNATAGGNGGGLHTEGSIAIAAASTLAISNSTAEHGGGFHVELYGSTPGLLPAKPSSFFV